MSCESVKDNHGDILRPLNEEEVEELYQLYKTKYGKLNFKYLLMYNQRKWDRQLKVESCSNQISAHCCAFRKQFYTHRDSDFRKYGTYVSLHFDLMQSVSFNTWQEGGEELLECLNKTNRIDWKRGPLLTDVEMHFAEEVKEIAKRRGTSVQRARQCWGVILQHEEALKIEVQNAPKDFYVAPLCVKHADQVHELWPNKKEGSLEYVRGLIEINKTLGIFSEANNELVAWSFQNDFAGIGILQVQPSFQRKGFGILLTKNLCKTIALTEEVAISAWYVVENQKSEALLKKAGFHKYVMNEWIQMVNVKQA